MKLDYVKEFLKKHRPVFAYRVLIQKIFKQNKQKYFKDKKIDAGL